jgi:hypothetical protein
MGKKRRSPVTWQANSGSDEEMKLVLADMNTGQTEAIGHNEIKVSIKYRSGSKTEEAGTDLVGKKKTSSGVLKLN